MLRVFRYSKVREMKICMISYSVYEFDNRVHRYGESLSHAGHEVDVIGLGRLCDMNRGVFNRTKLYRIQCRKFDEKGPVSYLIRIMRFLIKAFFMVSWLHLRHRYHVIHYHNIPDFGVFCTLIPKLLGAKIILDIHDLVPEFYARKFDLETSHWMVRSLKYIEKVSCRYVDHVIISNHIWKEWVVHRSVPERKCTVIMNAPYPLLFDLYKDEPKQKDRNRFVVLYHGALNEHFGVDIAIRAIDLVRKEIPLVLLKIYGTGREESMLKQLTHQLGINKYVRFHTPVPRSEIAKLIRDADIGVVPKRSARFADTALSSKLLEFAYMRKPIVVSRTTASEYYFDENKVRFFEPEKIEDLSRSITELAQKPEMRKDLSTNVDIFNKEHNWNRYKRIYFELLHRRSCN